MSALKRYFANRSRKKSQWRRAGDRARDRGDWQAAAAGYQSHLERWPEDAPIRVQLGHSLKEGGDLTAASEAYCQAALELPNDPDLLLSRGHLAKLRGDLGTAAGFYWASYDANRNGHALDALKDPALSEALLELQQKLPRRIDKVLPPVAGAVDITDEGQIIGWTLNPEDPAALVEVGIFRDNVLLATIPTGIFCDSDAAIAAGCLTAGFKSELLLDTSGDEKLRIIRLADGRELAGSPIQFIPPSWLSDWCQRRLAPRADAIAQLEEKLGALDTKALLSIIIPVFRPKREWIAQVIDSVLAQWADQWELILVDDGSGDPDLLQYLSHRVAEEPRIKLLAFDDNRGIAACTNEALAVASGGFIAFLDQDDVLEPDAVWRVLNAIAPDTDLIYSDEVITSEHIGHFVRFVARPAFSWDYYLSHPYFVHFIAIRTVLARRLGGLDRNMPISADVDFILRVIGEARVVTHVPAILYRWRRHESSTGHRKKDDVTDASLHAIRRHVQKAAPGAEVSPTAQFNFHRIDFPDDKGLVAIVIPTRDRVDLLRQCVDSIRATTDASQVRIIVADNGSIEEATYGYFAEIDEIATIVPCPGPFNYPAINNKAVAEAAGDARYLLFLNNDVEAIEPGWLEHMRGLCGRHEVGAVGATLLYGNGQVQHAGVLIGVGGPAEHAQKFAPYSIGGARNIGYNGSLLATRDFSAVTAACMMIRRSVFEEIAGFDPTLTIGFNDTDLCLRLSRQGYAILNDAHAVLYHHESQTRRSHKQMEHPEDADTFVRRWIDFIEQGDPFYNPMLDRDAGPDHRLNCLETFSRPRSRAVQRPRVGKL